MRFEFIHLLLKGSGLDYEIKSFLEFLEEEKFISKYAFVFHDDTELCHYHVCMNVLRENVHCVIKESSLGFEYLNHCCAKDLLRYMARDCFKLISNFNVREFGL